MTARSGKIRHDPDEFPLPSLYPSEAEIALRVLGRERAHEWPAKAAVLAKRGLPPINTLYGGRYWPKVARFFHIEEGLDEHGAQAMQRGRGVRIVPFQPDGHESFHAEKEEFARHQRRDRRPHRTRP
jgi:hypothetical protein